MRFIIVVVTVTDFTPINAKKVPSRYQKGILSKEDIAPFEYLFPSINLGPEIHL